MRGYRIYMCCCYIIFRLGRYADKESSLTKQFTVAAVQEKYIKDDENFDDHD